MGWRLNKRFYEDAATACGEGGFSVLLDGRPVKTPRGAPLILPGKALALAIAQEWQDQPSEIHPETMPLTRLAVTAIDRVRPEREAVVQAVSAYAETDLLCYRAETPPDLAARQAQLWQPLLDWCRDFYGVRLRVTTGVIPVEQPPQALHVLRGAVDACDDPHLAALSTLTADSGSLILALALMAGRIDAAAAWEAALLDERYQASKWGEDAEALALREALRADLHGVAEFLALLDR